MSEQVIEGFLLINKPTGVTSYYCIKKIKQALGQKTKIGHAGTLDSFATGLLIVGIGRPATRHLGQLMQLDKKYTATGKLGQLTDTLDFTGRLIEDKEASAVTKTQIESAIKQIGHQYKQTPPIYSALKYEGKTLSSLARSGKLLQEELEEIAQEKSRIVNMYSCQLISLDLPYFTIEAHVSHGTYIRVLVDDIAEKLSTHATTHELSRVQIGPFTIENATPLKEIRSIDDILDRLINVDNMTGRIAEYSA